MAMHTINVTLPAEPSQETDPLGTFLLLEKVRNELLALDIHPDDHRLIERTHRTLVIHCPAERDTVMRLMELLESFRGLMGYSIRIAEPNV
ncbi:MAG: hypothetical protein PHX93_03705 [Candidatus Peribacteraceae bacterium]|jgi:hypothetical protein|nr:hypothetical protein [Candidatus Peribacteraceae bacterium]